MNPERTLKLRMHTTAAPCAPRPVDRGDGRRARRASRTTATRRPGSVARAGPERARWISPPRCSVGTGAQPSSARGWIQRRRWIASMYIPRCRRIRRRTAISCPTPPSATSCDCSWRGLARSVDCSRPCTGNSPSPPWVAPTPPASSHPISWALGYEDVRAAWRYYLAHDNGNRGIVLIGHSQGTSILTELIRREIEGTPVQSRIVSALLIGGPDGILVPRGQDVGGTFPHLPVCRAATQTGCVVAYSSFRSRTAGGEHALRAVAPTRHSSRRAPIPRRSAAARPPSTAISTRQEEPPCRSGPQIRGPLADDP